MSRRVSLSAAEARRIALTAQGFDRPRPSNPSDVRHFRRALANITVLQLDFVNVLLPAHFLMIWSRLGPYDRNRFEQHLYHSGEYIEHWAHEASVVAASDWPLLEYRRSGYREWKRSPLHNLSDKNAYLAKVLRKVRETGASTSNDFPNVAGPTRKPGDWQRSIPRCALEYHFGKGNLSVRHRLKNFQRVYDCPERIIDGSHFSTTVSQNDAQRQLITKAADALGIGTLHDLADYYRMNARDVAPRVEELLEEGRIAPVVVEGWSDQAYLAATARSPRAINGASLLSPFDPVTWFRPRALRLFNFDYRIEIYVPEAKRRWGYYVLPFRLGDEIVARIDLKADRKAGQLRVQNAHLEPGADSGKTIDALGRELKDIAAWLDLERIRCKKASAFEKALARVCS